jgi:hypothetical protein
MSISRGFDPSRCEGRAGPCKHAGYSACVDFAASLVVGSSEPDEPVGSALAHLDEGEREAISLASELQATLDKEIEGFTAHGFRVTVLGTQQDGDWNGKAINVT